MTVNIGNLSPYLRTSRTFPQDAEKLALELTRTYTDIATNVNARTIGLFTTNTAVVGGEIWFVNSTLKQNQQRKVFPWSGSTLTIPHGLNFQSITNFVRIWGTFYDGTYWHTLPYIDTTDVTKQINVKISSTDIIITIGAGNTFTITNGIVILEWIVNAPNPSTV